MKSRASFKSHPLHPILVCFPIAFYTGTWVFDILALLYDPVFLHTAYTLEKAAIGSAVVAAIPGIIDYTYTVPPASSAKKEAASTPLRMWL